MVTNDFYPLVVLYGYQSKKDELSFIGRDGLVVLIGKSLKIRKILQLCNGLNSIGDIARDLSSIRVEEVKELLSICESRGIVRDSRELYRGFHEDSSNPPTFSRDLGFKGLERVMASQRLRVRDGQLVPVPLPTKSSLIETIQKRLSTRLFKSGQIPISQLSGILKVTYGVGENKHWSVASGGGMYPLDLYLIVPNDQQVVSRGIYRWNPETSSLSTMSDENPHLWLSKVFNAKTLLENAACILCIAVNFKRTAAKYANLAYRLAVIEAGHAAQNTSLFCAEQGIGIVECCGFADRALAGKLGLVFPDEAVLTTLITGYIDDNTTQAVITDRMMSETADVLRHALVGIGKPIEEVSLLDLNVEAHSMPRWTATASYRPFAGHLTTDVRKRSVAFATGFTSSEAIVKVLAEGFERYALEQNRSDRNESAVMLGEPFYDPRVAVPYSHIQYRNLPGIIRFDPRRKIDWVIGTRMVSGQRILVPMELVYYTKGRTRQGTKPCYNASSSGVAAHFNKDIAVKMALYELIERDAFCITWYSKRRVHSLPYEVLSADLKSRISCWKKLGYEVSLLDLTLDGPPVVLVLIWSRHKTPALCSGASCRPILLEAIEKAFDEAEFMAMTWHHYKPRRNMKTEDINDPADHGLFYVDPKNLVHVEWLLQTQSCKTVTKDFDGSLQFLDPVLVDITPRDHNCGLKVVRILSEKLMPINFGYGNEHRGHLRMGMLQYKWSEKYPATPHFFA